MKARGGLLNGQNFLSVTKVICWQSLNLKNQVVYKSKIVSTNEAIDINHRQISLSWADHFNSKLFSFRKKTFTQFFNISENLQESYKKYIFLIYSFCPTVYNGLYRIFNFHSARYVYLWNRAVHRFLNNWSMKKKNIFSFVSISQGFY